VTDKEENDTDV